jgi:hypothetical protein
MRLRGRRENGGADPDYEERLREDSISLVVSKVGPKLRAIQRSSMPCRADLDRGPVARSAGGSLPCESPANRDSGAAPYRRNDLGVQPAGSDPALVFRAYAREVRSRLSGTFGVVEGQNEPEFHDRFSIHPESAESCRAILMAVAQHSGIEGAEEEVQALSDWECVQKVKSLHRGVISRTKALQGLTRTAKATSARFAALGEAIVPMQGEQLANETELFLAIDHSA